MSDIEWSPWIEHEGEDCPVDGMTKVSVRFADGQVVDGCIAQSWHWNGFEGRAAQITSYRIPMEDYKRITGMPDWSEAPEWAQWLAQDKGGEWFFFLDKPRMDDLIKIWDADETQAFASSGADLVDWRDTLQKRPSDQLESHPNSELDADQYTVGGDTVNMPSHYTSGEIECIDAIQAQMTPEQFEGYLHGACAKYLWRYNMKGGSESLRKARWCLDRLISHYEKIESENK